MKTTNQTLLAAIMLLAISCTKENNSIQSSGITGKSATQALSSGANELVGAYTVRIGTQVWKIKDLTTSYYKNGDKIPQVKDPVKWSKLTTGAWCWYDNNPAKGKLYNWYAVNDSRGLAPAGWHIPSDAEWETLETFLGGQNVAGGKLKETGTTHWLFPNTGATNSTGFTGLPGGSRDAYNGIFGTAGALSRYGGWWSSDEFSVSAAYNRHLLYDWPTFDYDLYDKRTGFSVRCIKD